MRNIQESLYITVRLSSLFLQLLQGYDAVIKETARLMERKIEQISEIESELFTDEY